MCAISVLNILLVEDQYFARLALHTVIDGRSDMRVVAETARGVEAVPLYSRHRPDVTIMDLRLPDVSGFTAIAAIRALDGAARIVVLSNYEGSEDMRRALDAGALAYLTKDASAAELVAAIEAAAAGRRYLPRPVARRLAESASAEELTPREREVLAELAHGLSNKEIAERLGMAEKTARIHVSRILDKLGVADRTQAALLALQNGLVHFGE